MRDELSDFERLSFIGTIMLGCTALLGMILACAIGNNAGALGLALAAAGIAYLDQMLITWEFQGSKEPSWFVVGLGIMSMLVWVGAGVKLLYGG